MTGNLEKKPVAGELSRAVEQNDTGAVEALLRRGADINEKYVYGMTPLMTAAYHGRNAALQLLVAGGADVDAGNNEGWTALVYAVVGNKMDSLRLLIDSGADVHRCADDGNTAQSVAEKLKKPEMVRLLKEYAERYHVVSLQKQERLKKLSVRPVIRGPLP